MDVESLPAWIEDIDTILIDNLADCLIRHSRELFNAQNINIQSRSIYVNGIRYDLKVAPSVDKETHLLVCLMPRDVSLKDSDARLYKVAEAKLDGLCRYSHITFELTKYCQIRERDFLITLAREVFLVGHNWLNEKAMRCIREVAEDANRSLYEYMRTIVSSPELMQGFVFSALLDGKDFVMLDETAARTAMTLATSSAHKLGRSAADLAVQAMTQVIASEESVIVDAIKEIKVMDFDLTKDKYYQTDHSFSDSMRAVWGPSVSCFPIMREGRMLLIALFRTEYRTHLEPLLLVHQECLEELAQKKIDRMKKMLQVLVKVREDGWATTGGELLGTFVGSLLKVFEHHP